MYHIIASIAERAHATAVKRGKDVSASGCLRAVGTELNEFWAALDGKNKIADPEATVKAAMAIQDDAEFTAYYDAQIHNTPLALFLVRSSWLLPGTGPPARKPAKASTRCAAWTLCWPVARCSLCAVS